MTALAIALCLTLAATCFLLLRERNEHAGTSRDLTTARDAVAREHAANYRLLLSSIEHAASAAMLCRDLARVTAERDGAHRVIEHLLNEPLAIFDTVGVSAVAWSSGSAA